MSAIRFKQTSTATPEQFIAGLADFGPGRSNYTYRFTRRADGMTDVDVVVVHEGRNVKGRLLGLVLGTVGKRFLVRGFGEIVRAIEARHFAASPAASNGPTMGMMC
jgi:hypothetical protein